MKTRTLRVLIFVASMLLSAGLFWVAGFNFDRRGEDVALNLWFAIFASAFMASCPYIQGNDEQ